MKLYLQAVRRSAERIEADVQPSDRVHTLLEFILPPNVPRQGFRFVYKGQVLNLHLRLADYEITEGSTIYYCPVQEEGSASSSDGRLIPQTQFDDILSSPIMETVTRNTDLLMLIMDSNPTIQALRRRSPELNALLSDPQTIQDAFQAMRNPAMMRELMRTSDRALINIDAVPGGFDALRQVYRDVQEPVWESVSAGVEPVGTPQQTYAVRSSVPADEPFPQAWGGESVVQPSSNPNRYREQLQALRDMGFSDLETCERALDRHGGRIFFSQPAHIMNLGNLNRAIDDLLNQNN